MKTSTKGLIALMNSEGVVLPSYKDSANVWTLGVGHTRAAGVPKPGPGVSVTLKQAVDLFRRDIVKYEAGVNRAIKVPLKQHEFDALVHWHYNSGAIATATLTKKINAGDMHGAAAEFARWNKITVRAGGKKKRVVSKGLVTRRKMETALFTSGNYGQLSTVLVYPGVTSHDRPTGATRMSTTEVLSVPRERPPVDTVVAKPKPEVVQTPPVRANLWGKIVAFILNWRRK